MAKSRSRKPRKKQNPRATNKIISIPRLQAVAALDALTMDFLPWAQKYVGADTKNAMAMFAQITDLLGDYAQVTGATEITRIDPTRLAHAMNELPYGHPEDMDSSGMTATLLLYLDFLNQTGRWTGTDMDYVMIRDLLDGRDLDKAGIIELPEVSEGEALAYFEIMPLVQYARNLVQWIDESKEITSTEALKLKDVVAGAARVGVEVRTKRDAADPGIPLVHSMHQIERLKLIWEALLISGILSASSTRVMPTADAKIFVEQQPESEACELTEKFIGFFLIITGEYIHDTHGSKGRHIRGRLMQNLDLALYPEKPETPRIDGSSVDLINRSLILWMLKLQELGVVNVGKHFDVDLALTRSVDMFSMYVTRDELNSRKTEDPAVAEPGINKMSVGHAGKPTGLPDLPAALEDQSLQLRVVLEYSEPPIWRRLVVPASMNLGDMHFALQVAFGWNNSHLHNFEQRSADGSQVFRFSNGDMDDDMAEDEDEDEDQVSVGRLARQPEDTFYYNYDFGDSWRLKLTLEKAVDTAQGQLVRCTGGGMRSPVDDIGGIPGWEYAIEVLADSEHEDHQQYREILDLRPGRTFNPSDFSAQSIDEEFGRLFK